MSFPSGFPPLPPGTVVFGPKANCTLDICPVEISVYGYRPALSANGAFLALYSIAAIIHAYLGIRWKSWFFMGCMLLGCLNAILGYAARLAMWYNPFGFPAFMIQIVCVTSVPVYFCAAIYVTLAYAVTYFNPSLSRLRPRLIYQIFIPCDLFSLVVQASGGALATASAGTSQAGVYLGLVGLATQVFTLVVFCALFADYLGRYFRRRGDEATGRFAERRVQAFFAGLGTAVLAILVRCAYRLAELHEGYRGGLVRDEALFVVFEGVLIVISIYALMIGHPGLVFNQKHATLAGSSETEMVTPQQTVAG